MVDEKRSGYGSGDHYIGVALRSRCLTMTDAYLAGFARSTLFSRLPLSAVKAGELPGFAAKE